MLVSRAHADDSTAVRKREWFRPDEEPLLHIDPVWRPVRALDGVTDITRATYSLGRTLAVLERTGWTDSTTAAAGEGRGPSAGVTGDGWGATLRLSRDLGPVRVAGHASYQALDTRLLRGSYVDLGLSVGRTFELSAWMTAWIALSVGQRDWRGELPEGETNERTIMLSIGTSFR